MTDRSLGMYLAYITQAFVFVNVLIAVYLGDISAISIGIIMFVMGMVLSW